MATAGTLMFPNDAIFTNLVRLSEAVSDVVILDEYGIEAGYQDLFDDISQLRQALRERLPAESFDSRGLLRPEHGCIASITTSVYYFLVGFFTIASLGGACVPLSNTDSLEEILYFLKKVNASSILSDPWTANFSRMIKHHFQEIQEPQPEIIRIQRAERHSASHVKTEIDETLRIPERHQCLIIFSSGTTGKPKGVVLPRRRFFFPACQRPRLVYLTYRPVHWISSALTPIKSLLRGDQCICLKRGAGPGDVWEALRAGNITAASITPVRLKAMQEYYHSTICHMSREEQDSYISGFSNLKLLTSGGSILHPATTKFWKDLTNISIVGIYGTTEIAIAAFKTSHDHPHADSYLGKLEPTVTAKLSNGEEGELFLRTPGMFTGYFGDEDATKAVFDEEGFYNTGDLVRREGDHYFFLGRSSSDWIRFSAFTVSVIELEKHLLDLPYIVEAYVLPVMDFEARELVAALVRLENKVTSDESHPEVNLYKIREDLSSTVEPYKLPRLLRILQEGETIPLTSSDKARKNEIRQQYFKLSGYRPRDYAVPRVEFLGNETGSQFLAEAKKLPS